MSRLIDADALKANVPNTNVDIFENCRNCNTLMDWQVKELIGKMPTIDAVEVVHGEWIEAYGMEEAMKGTVICSNCGESYSAIVLTSGEISLRNQKTKYCPNCGAKMDGERRDPCSSQDS